MALGLALLLAVPGGCRRKQPAEEDAGAPEPPAASDPRREEPVQVIYPAAPGSFVDLGAELRSAVVHLAGESRVAGGPASLFPRPEPSQALGSGFLIATGDGTYVVTNDHVVAGAGTIRAVLADGTRLAARVVGRDARLDVALLEVDGSPELSPAELGSSERLQPGEWVLALGNPFGGDVTLSAGILSSRGLSGEEELLRSEGPALGGFLVTDAAIHPGNSGGPLVNMAGEVVGINTAVDAKQGSVGFAVPIDRARDILPMLREEGRVIRAWLGVKIHPVDGELAGRLELPSADGALVSEVIPGGPAAKAGLRRGDVILSYDEREVDDKSLPWMVATSGLGAKSIVVWRDGGERHLTVVAEKMPE